MSKMYHFIYVSRSFVEILKHMTKNVPSTLKILEEKFFISKKYFLKFLYKLEFFVIQDENVNVRPNKKLKTSDTKKKFHLININTQT